MHVKQNELIQFYVVTGIKEASTPRDCQEVCEENCAKRTECARKDQCILHAE